MDVRTKVTRLLDGIQTETLDAVKTNILGSETLRKDFEKCVILYKDFIKQSGSSRTENRRVAEISLNGGGDETVEDRYYSKDEYKKLSNAAKGKLKKLREGRPNDRGGSNEPKKKIQKLEQKAKTYKRTIKELRSKIKENSDSGGHSSSDESEEKVTNRNHSALTRQGKRNGKDKRGGKKKE